MYKNRRITLENNMSIFQNPLTLNIKALNFQQGEDKQNQAKSILFNIGHDDSYYQGQFVQNDLMNIKGGILQKLKAQQQRSQFCEIKRIKLRSSFTPLQTSENTSIKDISNIYGPASEKKNRKVSFRNALYLKNKQNMTAGAIESNSMAGKQEKTTFGNLKNILKKLESPQKVNKNIKQPPKSQTKETIKKRKSKQTLIAEYFSQFFLKQNEVLVPSSILSRPVRKQNNLFLSLGKQNQKRGGTKTSQDKRRDEIRESGPIENNIGFNLTPCVKNQSKFTNHAAGGSMFFKRNITTACGSSAELLKKFKQQKPMTRQFPTRLSYKSNTQHQFRNQFSDVLLQQQKLKQQRKSRNLKNILFD